ncbi:MAG TPA: Uma2 family endonuclease [Longimicrobium sp.]|nr:Uma2 family endonuclease [Longimicrobium sp.]
MSYASLGREATLEDLWAFEGQAELIDGKLVPMTPTVFRPGRAAARIRRSLDVYENAVGGGLAVSEGVGFVLSTPRIQALIPDAAWWTGTPQEDALLNGPPAFAVEVRGRNDYGPTAERAMAYKRALYFAAGTAVVWDVDVLREGVVRVYRADDPDHPTVYRRGEVAEAEPAVPGWRMPVDELFD